MSETMESKERIRREIRMRRAALSPEWIASASERVAERFMALEAFQTAETICLYMAIAGEVQLDAVMAQCWEDGRRVLVPAYRPAQQDYGFKVITSDMALAEGPWGVPEPATDAWADVGSTACLAVPGMAFDEAGGRVGHGGGYYDRLLASVGSDRSRVGVCFDFQRVERVPREAWDVGMDFVVSESRVTRGMNA